MAALPEDVEVSGKRYAVLPDEPRHKSWLRVGWMNFMVGIPPQNVQRVVIMVDSPQSLLAAQADAGDAVPTDSLVQLA